MLYLNISSTPPGEAPEWVREQWVGLSLPLAQQSAAPKNWPMMGVLTGHKSRVLQTLFWMLGRYPLECGYLVESRRAIEILETCHQDAATWWRQNSPQ
jgi:hypothetical protein